MRLSRYTPHYFVSRIRTLVRVSRPRFWIYTAGPYLIGHAAVMRTGGGAHLTGIFWYGLFFFLIPANIIMYGVNDLYDQDTDQYNEKKRSYEHLLKAEHMSLVKVGTLMSLLAAVPLVLMLWSSPLAVVFLLAFLVLSVAYSVPPIRLKARPFLDSLSNIFYIFPGCIAYLAWRSTHMSELIFPLVAGGCWTAALHLFSAIPDIAADTRAQLSTTATTLGERRSLYLCMLLWGTSAVTTLYLLGWPALLGLVYPALPLLVLARRRKLFAVYQYMPKINLIIGFILFWYVVLF